MSKKSIILIICVLLIIVIILCAYIVLNKNASETEVSNSSITEELYEPEITVTTEKDGSSTIIYIEATIDGDNLIETIVMPDGEVVEDSEAEYRVAKSGEYEFVVTASNGTSVTKIVTIEDTDEISADNPYIPNGFTHVSGTEVETGYVIEDESGNQYVWVPVESGILIRNTDGNSQYEESDSTSSGLYNSVAKYYGFYIARYEASQAEYDGTETIASIEGVLPLSNVTYSEAYKYCLNAATVYEYEGVKTALVNSYAWDTTLDWLNETETNYSSNTSYGNYSGKILETGATENDEINLICDLAGNLREWTTEIYYPETTSDTENEVELEETEEDTNITSDIAPTYRVIRGGSANINKVAGSHIGQLENMSDSYWGFRMILYKN